MTTDPNVTISAHLLRDTRNVADVVYDLLRSKILESHFPAGTWIKEVELAEQLGVSRTPLREAVSRLMSDRLVKRGRRGIEVVNAQAEIRGMWHVRIALEGYATRLAALNMSDRELDELAEVTLHGASLPFEARQERVANNNNFHMIIYRGAGVGPLFASIERCLEYFLNEGELSKLTLEEMIAATGDHASILSALRARDAGLAEELMRSHLLRAFKKTHGVAS